VLTVFCLSAAPAAAQDQPLAFSPPAAGIPVTTNVEYAVTGDVHLAMDVYTPPVAASGGPALVFFNRGTGEGRRTRLYDGWARAAASQGIVGVLADLRQGNEAADFRLLIAYLDRHGAQHGVGAIAVYAASGNVFSALPVVEDPSLTSIRAAVMYYGSAPVSAFRLDLPVLVVRAGLDRPSVNEEIAALMRAAVAQNAPVTLLNHAGGHHGFEQVDNDAASRAAIDATLDFVTRATSVAYQASLRASIAEATAAGQVQTGKFHDGAAGYAVLVATQPANARLRLAYGEALLGDGQFAAACGEFEKLRDKGLGYRDLGLPAAEACLKKGDPEAAIAWLRSIPPQFRPASLQNDPAFAALRDRADFQALFSR